MLKIKSMMDFSDQNHQLRFNKTITFANFVIQKNKNH